MDKKEAHLWVCFFFARIFLKFFGTSIPLREVPARFGTVFPRQNVRCHRQLDTDKQDALLRCPKFFTRCPLTKFRPLPLAHLASSATGSARIAPHRTIASRSSNLPVPTKKKHTRRCVSFLFLVYTLDAAFFHSRYLKNFEKAATFVRKFRH